jgi:hypothetical protein
MLDGRFRRLIGAALLFRVKPCRSRHLTWMSEVPQLAAGIAAAARTGSSCHLQTKDLSALDQRVPRHYGGSRRPLGVLRRILMRLSNRGAHGKVAVQIASPSVTRSMSSPSAAEELRGDRDGCAPWTPRGGLSRACFHIEPLRHARFEDEIGADTQYEKTAP